MILVFVRSVLMSRAAFRASWMARSSVAGRMWIWVQGRPCSRQMLLTVPPLTMASMPSRRQSSTAL